MRKEVIVLVAHVISISLFVILSLFINNLIFIDKIKAKNYIKNLILGIPIILIGILLFYVSYNIDFLSNILNLVKYIIPVYIITTGLTFSFIGYLSKED